MMIGLLGHENVQEFLSFLTSPTFRILQFCKKALLCVALFMFLETSENNTSYLILQDSKSSLGKACTV